MTTAARTIHDLKTIPPYWADVASGRKSFEVRSTVDRQFRVGDELVLREWAYDLAGVGVYTGRVAHARVTYLLAGPGMGIPANVAVMGILVLPDYCMCGHRLTGHELTAAGRRTYCCTGSQAGPCPCKAAVPVGQVTS